MTPAGRSRQYVREICRRIGEDKIELGNACRSVAAKRPKPNTAAAGAGHRGGEEGGGPDVMVEDSVVEGGGSEGSGEGTDVVEVKVKAKEEEGEDGGDDEAGRWKVVDARGKARFFDEVRERDNVLHFTAWRHVAQH